LKSKLLLAVFCGSAALVGAAYALAGSHDRHNQSPSPVQAGVGRWLDLDDTGLGTRALGIAHAAGAGATAKVAGIRGVDGSYAGIVRDAAAGLRFTSLTANPGDAGASSHLLRHLADISLVDGSLGLLTLEQAAAPDGSVGRIYGAGVVKPPSTQARLELLDGSVVSLPLVDLAAGFRGFAFIAAEPKQFPKAIQGVDATGKVVAEFAFDPNSHP
jgi:hypothetical protein